MDAIALRTQTLEAYLRALSLSSLTGLVLWSQQQRIVLQTIQGPAQQEVLHALDTLRQASWREWCRRHRCEPSAPGGVA